MGRHTAGEDAKSTNTGSMAFGLLSRNPGLHADMPLEPDETQVWDREDERRTRSWKAFAAVAGVIVLLVVASWMVFNISRHQQSDAARVRVVISTPAVPDESETPALRKPQPVRTVRLPSAGPTVTVTPQRGPVSLIRPMQAAAPTPVPGPTVTRYVPVPGPTRTVVRKVPGPTVTVTATETATVPGPRITIEVTVPGILPSP